VANTRLASQHPFDREKGLRLTQEPACWPCIPPAIGGVWRLRPAEDGSQDADKSEFWHVAHGLSQGHPAVQSPRPGGQRQATCKNRRIRQRSKLLTSTRPDAILTKASSRTEATNSFPSSSRSRAEWARTVRSSGAASRHRTCHCHLRTRPTMSLLPKRRRWGSNPLEAADQRRPCCARCPVGARSQLGTCRACNS